MQKQTVKCDICQDEMKESNNSYVCWPCKHVVYKDQLYLNDALVEVHEIGADVAKEAMNALGSEV